ncbi:MAG: hypothetical protein H7256_11040 [Bdellovibrio sp.]|nr:hypothetical protein [Bdellovibrio sp.]
MIKTYIVTLLVNSVICLVGGMLNPAYAATNLKTQQVINNKLVISADQLPPEIVEKGNYDFTGILSISRNTSLYDFQDGTRKDSIDYLAIPSLALSFGTFSAKISFAQDLRDDSAGASDWNDFPVTYAMKAIQWQWSPPYIITLTPTLTALIPTNAKTIKRDQLQSALTTGISFGIIPDGIAQARDGAWNLALGLTAGRAFHAYDVDINGLALNKYSSNQTANLGYTYKSVSLSAEYIHKTRWTYQGATRDSFIVSQELGYSISDRFAVAIGHTNEGSGLKANATESNFSLVNENDSTVYGQLAVSF